MAQIMLSVQIREMSQGNAGRPLDFFEFLFATLKTNI